MIVLVLPPNLFRYRVKLYFFKFAIYITGEEATSVMSAMMGGIPLRTESSPMGSLDKDTSFFSLYFFHGRSWNFHILP